LELAVEEGAQVVFTTTPKLSRATLKAAVKYPKVRFLNCSVYAPYSSIRTYYSRIYEAKFLAGALAGAMSENDWIGYVGDYPIFGVPASINAYALGAQLTNPRARIVLRWSCQEGNPVEEFIQSGIRVISNRDIPSASQQYLEFGSYGTYLVEEDRSLRPIGSPCWMWGKFYEHVIRSIFSGAWDRGKDAYHAVNYWWGIDSGVIDIKVPENLPEGLRVLLDVLRKGIQRRTLDPFCRRILAQDGTVKNPGNRTLAPEELLHMDWLCENVEGCIPEFDQIQPYARDMVRELGVYRDRIPMEKEGAL
jgi:basic membrane lipoprotein Med (substrate-binding protein (PBP1-ABC) superfamily)